jgi:hypothetical protein
MIRFLLIKSTQPGLFDFGTGGTNPNPHHVGYRRVNSRGTVSIVAQRGAPKPQQLGLDFSRPAPPPPPKQKTIADVVREDSSFQGFIDNGRNILELLTGGRTAKDRQAHKDKLKQERHDAYLRYSTAYKEAAKEHPDHTGYQDILAAHPEVKRLSMEHDRMLDDHLKAQRDSGKDEYEKVIAWLQEGNDIERCRTKAKEVTGGGLKNREQQKAIGDFYAMVGTGKTPTYRWTESMGKDFRACASPTGYIKLDEKANRTTVIHEIAHHIEFSHPEVERAAAQFRYSKCERKGGSTSLKPLKEIVPGSRYDADERAMTDKFVSPYVGKFYSDGSTEVVSMGMQHLGKHNDFIKLLDKDPEHAHFIIGMLHHLKNKPDAPPPRRNRY